MNKSDQPVHVFHSLSELHRAVGQPKPQHPLISIVNYGDIKADISQLGKGVVLNFYKISFKSNFHGKIRYGQGFYDFEEGGMAFIAPGQLIRSVDEEADYAGMSLHIHPDFIRPYSLHKTIKQYGFFSYTAAEALYLSEKEKETIMTVFNSIKQELNERIDRFSQDVIISQIELLLNYSNRFYNRQFLTRKAVNNDLLSRMETLLDHYFNEADALQKGLPGVQYLANELNVSSGYLSDMLRNLTGLNAQQHIHQKLIEKAKEYLTTGHLSVAEIAYRLGFERPQAFSKMFKQKTSQTPLEFKRSFN
jgi:AraC-like DNA-binding protein